MNRYALNATPVVVGTFRNADGALDDPDTVALVVTPPAGAPITYAGGQLVHTSTGIFTKQLVANQVGTWSYAFTGTEQVGPVSAASSFEVVATLTVEAAGPYGPTTRVVANRDSTLRFHLEDEGGGPATADPSTSVTCTVLAGDGATVVAGGTATADPGIPGVYTFTLPAQTSLDRLTAVLTATVDSRPYQTALAVDVVAFRLVDLWRLRQVPELAPLALDDFLEAVNIVEEWIRGRLGFPPVPEGARVAWTGGGHWREAPYPSVTGIISTGRSPRLLIPGVVYPLSLYSLSVDGTALSTTDLGLIRLGTGALSWSDGRGFANGEYAAWLTHGLAAPPGDLRRAATTLVKEVVRKSDYPARASSVTTDKATILFNLPGPGRPTGIPDVDAVLERISHLAGDLAI